MAGSCGRCELRLCSRHKRRTLSNRPASYRESLLQVCLSQCYGPLEWVSERMLRRDTLSASTETVAHRRFQPDACAARDVVMKSRIKVADLACRFRDEPSGPTGFSLTCFAKVKIVVNSFVNLAKVSIISKPCEILGRTLSENVTSRAWIIISTTVRA